MNTKKSAADQKDVSLPLSGDPLFGFIMKNKNVLIAALILIVVVVAVSRYYVGHTEKNEQAAWAEFFTASKEKDTTNSVAALSGILDDTAGTTAEPWVLYYLSIQAFKNNDLATAKEKFDLLEKNFPDHYLLENPEWAPSIKRKIVAEIEWLDKNPIPTEPAPPEENAEGEPEKPEDAANE